MNMSPQMREMLLGEINYVIKKMDKSDDPAQKLYYFSAIFGAIQRIFNIEYDPDLIIAHFILSQAHKGFMGRLQDPTIPLKVDQMDKLFDLTKGLKKAIEKDNDCMDILKKFVLLNFSITGNGYYLYEKGILKF